MNYKLLKYLSFLLIALLLFSWNISMAAFSKTGLTASSPTPVIKTPISTITKSPTTKTPAKGKVSVSRLNRLVAAGTIIGYEGGIPETCGAGLSTGAHLHFEVRVNNSHVDPRSLLGKGLIWPFTNYRITQEYGPATWTSWYSFHTGIDLAGSKGAGTPVRAAASGKVIFDGQTNGYGHLIIIQHSKTLKTYYGHLRC